MSLPLDVALDITGMLASEPTGIPVYVRELANEFRRRPEQIRTHLFFKARLFRTYDEVLGALAIPAPRKWYVYSAPPRTDCPINHSLSIRFLYNRRAINIATLHDVKLFLPAGEGPEWNVRQKVRNKYAKANDKIVRKADHFIAVSETTKQDYCRLFDIDPDRITVVHLGSRWAEKVTENDDSVQEQFGIQPEGYLLFTGRVETDKNLIAMLRAFKASGLHNDLKFVLAGPIVESTQDIRTTVVELGLKDRVIFTGFISEAALGSLYENAKAYIFATYYEGFGLPIIEAMVHGLPVLVGDRGASLEVAGGHAVVADPYSIDNIAAGMQKVVSTAPDRATIMAYARQFTWGRTADQTMDVYRKLIADRA